MSEVVTAPRADRRLFSLHEEEEVVEVPTHRRQIFYLESNLRFELPDQFVGANMGIYWVPGQLKKPWAGPDVFVSRRPPKDPEPRVYLVWEDGPIQFIAEAGGASDERARSWGPDPGSDRTRRSERRKRERIYREALQVPEYLYVDLDEHQLELWRLQGGEYRPVREEEGRLFSEELSLWFGWGLEETFVRMWMPDGRMLLTVEETHQRLKDVDQRLEAEQQAQKERRLREEAESRAAALAAELERLRRGKA